MHHEDVFFSPPPPCSPLQACFKSFAAALTTTLTTCLEHCLRAVPGSYLCRTWEGELKYMCAFTDAQVRTRGFSGLRVSGGGVLRVECLGRGGSGLRV